jgi:threonine/homoserine/homoserine lactone efflux protein
MVVRSAARGGRRDALMTTIGNSAGVLAWSCFAAIGIAAVVATSAEAFTAVKLCGAVVLLVLGVQSLRGRRSAAARAPAVRAPLRDGLVTSLANPKLAVFFAALFPQFVPDGGAALPAALLMASLIVACDLVWFSTLAYLVARARRAFVEGPWLRRFDAPHRHRARRARRADGARAPLARALTAPGGRNRVAWRLVHHMRDEGANHRDHRVGALADGQHGVVSRHQLLTAGVGRGAIARAVDAGRLRPVFRGVYAVGHVALRREGWWLAALLACGNGAALSHRNRGARSGGCSPARSTRST